MTLPEVVLRFAATRSLLPVSKDKVGLLKWRDLQERRLSVEELEQYANAPAWAHITGKVSGIFTIDIDVKGVDWAKNRGLFPLAHRLTPSGGAHIDVCLPRGWLIKNTVGSLAAGVDTRGEGGIALIWGESTKGEYKWVRPFDESPIRYSDIPQPIQWMLWEHCKRQPNRQVTIDFSQAPISEEETEALLLKALSLAPFHGRNPMGFWLACRLRDGRIDKEFARAIGYQYTARVWNTNTHGQYEDYSNRHFDASLDSAYSGVAR